MDRGLQLTEIKRLFRVDELRQARIFTGTEPVPDNIRGKYHVFDSLIVAQRDERGEGCFHDHSVGVVKAGKAQGDGRALCQGQGASSVHAADHSLLLLREQAQGAVSEVATGLVRDQAQLEATDIALVSATDNAVVKASGHSLTRLHGSAVGFFADSAAFVANDQSHYSLSGNAKGVAILGADGLTPSSLNQSAVPTVSFSEAQLFYLKCVRQRQANLWVNKARQVRQLSR